MGCFYFFLFFKNDLSHHLNPAAQLVLCSVKAQYNKEQEDQKKKKTEENHR